MRKSSSERSLNRCIASTWLGRMAAVAFTTLLASVCACADGTLPDRAANDPANPDAPETSLERARPPASAVDPSPSVETMPGMSGMPAGTSMTNAHGADAPDAAKAVYACPMHSEVTSKSQGKCPKCGMTLVAKGPATP